MGIRQTYECRLNDKQIAEEIKSFENLGYKFSRQDNSGGVTNLYFGYRNSINEKEELVNKFLLSIIERWENGLSKVEMSKDDESSARHFIDYFHDFPKTPGDISIGDIINELKKRII